MDATPSPAPTPRRRRQKRPRLPRHHISLNETVKAEIARLAETMGRTPSSEIAWLAGLGYHFRDRLPLVPVAFPEDNLARTQFFISQKAVDAMLALLTRLNVRAARAGEEQSRGGSGRRKDALKGRQTTHHWSFSALLRYLIEAGLHIERHLDRMLEEMSTENDFGRVRKGTDPRGAALALAKAKSAEELAGMADQPMEPGFMMRWQINATQAKDVARAAFNARMAIEDLPEGRGRG